MDVLTSIAATRIALAPHRRAGRRIGLVPTMGYLHEGHMELVRVARRTADIVVVSIFVNPIQFGPMEDLSRYPRDFERDASLCTGAGVEYIFFPSDSEMYLPGFSLVVDETYLSKGLCGARRPGHFRGVTTVVAKLFNIIQPDCAVFGEKDFQQVRIIEHMVRDLNMPVAIVRVPTVREPDGLALSSRNKYLSPAERVDALCLSHALTMARKLCAEGKRDAGCIANAVRSAIATIPSARIDYVEIVDAANLQPVLLIERESLLALAVFIGSTRLIDNTILRPG